MPTSSITLNYLLDQVLVKKASDLHINAGAPPQIRIDGDLQPVGDEKLTPEDSKRICYEAIAPQEMKALEEEWELDTAMDFEDRSRFRVNLCIEQGHVSGALRPIPTVIPKVEDLGLPEAAVRLTEKPRGLVLVTGATGSGKSTSLAAMINRINDTRHEHIITVEDPIEFVHQSKNCLITQREVERDTKTFAAALKRVLRQDPDVVLIGEMRDIETIGTAITVSETGHLVFGTLHTNTAVSTINRVIDAFPAHQQPQIRTQLSFILEGVLCQQLVPKIGGGRILAMEIMTPTLAIRNLIREDKVHQIQAVMQMGRTQTGMQTMNQCLLELYQKKIITQENAISFSTDQDEMKRLVAGG